MIDIPSRLVDTSWYIAVSLSPLYCVGRLCTRRSGSGLWGRHAHFAAPSLEGSIKRVLPVRSESPKADWVLLSLSASPPSFPQPLSILFFTGTAAVTVSGLFAIGVLMPLLWARTCEVATRTSELLPPHWEAMQRGSYL